MTGRNFIKVVPLLAMVAAVAVPVPVLAYIGPSLSGGAVAATLGIVGSILLALFGVIYFPIKRALKRRKEAAQIHARKEGADTPEA